MDASETINRQQMLMETSPLSLVGAQAQVQTPLSEADQQQQQQPSTLCPRSLGLPASVGPDSADGMLGMTGSPSDSCYSDDKMNTPTVQAPSFIYGLKQQQQQHQQHQQPYLCPLPPLDATDMDASAAACPQSMHSLHTLHSSAPAATAVASSLYSCVPISPPLDPSDTVLDGSLENGSMAASFAIPTPPFSTTPLSTPLGFEHHSTSLQIPTSAEANYCSFAITTLPSQASSSFAAATTLPSTLVPSNMMDRFHRASPFAGSNSSSAGDEGYLSNEHSPGQHSPSSSPRAEEPYAQLIFKAFMSEPSHSMTLQQIYQWFRENTNKAANGEKGGWMNSIRHNLSMNKAFIKREKLSMGQDGHMQPVPDSKRSTEWVLQDWAAINGVESTTRYRPKTTAAARRAAAPRRAQADYGRRANAGSGRGGMAGRRSGCGIVGGGEVGGVGSRIGRRAASPRYGQSVEATTPPTHPMLHPSAYEYPDQAELSDFHHHHHAMEDSPGSSPGRHHYSPHHHHHHHHHQLGAPQLSSYHHQHGWDVYPSPPAYQMPAPAPHHHHQNQHQQSPVEYAYSLSSQQVTYDQQQQQQQQPSFRPTGSPAFTPEGLFPPDALCDLNRGGLWAAGPPKE